MRNNVPAPITRPDYGLTSREMEVLTLALQGLNGPRIAEQLGLQHGTIHSHMKKVHRKLGVHNRAAVVSVALSRGLVDSPLKIQAPATSFDHYRKVCPCCGR